MSMTNKYTTARQLQKAIDSDIVTITNVKVESKDDYSVKEISPDQFKDNLDFYLESGIFADSLDCKYGMQGDSLTVDIGNMSPYCDLCITVNLIVNDGVSREDLEKVLKRVEPEEYEFLPLKDTRGANTSLMKKLEEYVDKGNGGLQE